MKDSKMPEANLNIKFIEGRNYPTFKYEIFEVGGDKPQWRGTIHWPNKEVSYFLDTQSVNHLRMTIFNFANQGR